MYPSVIFLNPNIDVDPATDYWLETDYLRIIGIRFCNNDDNNYRLPLAARLFRSVQTG